MDYTAILSRLENIFSGTGGILLIAAIGVLGIVGAHMLRMRFASSRYDQKSKSYQNVVIEPYVDEEGGDPLEAMVPKFSQNQEQF
ncbi:MAG: hypothetical protein COB08_015515 [Rhodobacteraceae bacterium]|nr:hypothetical protein [Paracoccaceae bacterium]